MLYEPDLPALAPKGLPPGVQLASKSLEELGLMSDEPPSNDVLSRRWTPGEEAARSALDDFLAERLRDYAGTQAQLGDSHATSILSPHLHFGELSVRRVWYQTKQMEWLWAQGGGGVATGSLLAFQRSLGQREFGRYLSFHFPWTQERGLVDTLRAFPWRYSAADFKAWRRGATGYPLVDAGMRQLWATGWCHDRMRTLLASFLVRHLLLPWQWGLKHFWEALLDADAESAVLGWQRVSGGTPDGPPMAQLLDVEAEARAHDPQGHYVRRWVPQLARLPTEWLHAPWRAPRAVLEAAGVELGGNYPRPLCLPEEAQARLSFALASIDQPTGAELAQCAPRDAAPAVAVRLSAQQVEAEPAAAPPVEAPVAEPATAAADPDGSPERGNEGGSCSGQGRETSDPASGTQHQAVAAAMLATTALLPLGSGAAAVLDKADGSRDGAVKRKREASDTTLNRNGRIN